MFKRLAFCLLTLEMSHLKAKQTKISYTLVLLVAISIALRKKVV